ncbi:MAG: hypothetical protein ACRDJM_06450, partial [Actinomycetota bacterium]
SGAAPRTFHDEGNAAVATADANVTYELMQRALCSYPPPTQGLDAWVTQLPDGFSDGTYSVEVSPEQSTPDPRPDLDAFLLSRACEPTGSIASEAASEKGTITQGTRFVVTHLYTTLAADITVDVEPI